MASDLAALYITATSGRALPAPTGEGEGGTAATPDIVAAVIPASFASV